MRLGSCAKQLCVVVNSTTRNPADVRAVFVPKAVLKNEATVVNTAAPLELTLRLRRLRTRSGFLRARRPLVVNSSPPSKMQRGKRLVRASEAATVCSSSTPKTLNCCAGIVARNNNLSHTFCTNLSSAKTSFLTSKVRPQKMQYVHETARMWQSKSAAR